MRLARIVATVTALVIVAFTVFSGHVTPLDAASPSASSQPQPAAPTAQSRGGDALAVFGNLADTKGYALDHYFHTNTTVQMFQYDLKCTLPPFANATVLGTTPEGGGGTAVRIQYGNCLGYIDKGLLTEIA